MKILGLIDRIIIILIYSAFAALGSLKSGMGFAIVTLCFIGIWLYWGPIFKVKKGQLTIFYLFPFRRTVKLSIGEIQKVIINAGIGPFNISFLTDDREINLNMFISIWGLKRIYKYFLSIDLNVESKGPMTINWNP